MLDLSSTDYIIGGETDFAIGEIADYALKGEGNIDDALSILYKTEDGSFKRTAFHQWAGDLDSRPFPARHLMNNALYKRPDTDEPMATIQTARGCPSACVFCLTPIISGTCVRFRSPQNVLDEMLECYDVHGIKSFFFKADTFTIDPKWVKEMCELIINSKMHGNITFTANSRVNPLSKETLQLMKDAGCFMVAFGFESGSDEMLKTLRKGTTVEMNLRAQRGATRSDFSSGDFTLLDSHGRIGSTFWLRRSSLWNQILTLLRLRWRCRSMALLYMMHVRSSTFLRNHLWDAISSTRL